MISQKPDRNLIEYILSLLYMPESGQAAAVCQKAADSCCAQNSQSIQAAYSFIRFMDEMPGGFLIYHADDNEEIIYANKALLRICQCETLAEFRDFTKNSFKGFVYPQDLEAVEQSIQKQIAESKYDLDYVEYRMQRKDGKILWLEDYGHFVRNSSIGDIFYVFIGDATEKRLSHQTLLQEQSQKEQHLKNLLNDYDKERKVINQEHLRRLEVIEGLSVNYESILYADLDTDRVMPYRLSSRTIVQFEQTFQPRRLSWYIPNYIETWVHPEDREYVRKLTAPEYIRDKLSSQKTFYLNYRVLKDSKLQYIQLRIVNVGNKDRISQIVMGYRRVDDEVRREMEQKSLLENALNNANIAITAKNTFLSNMSHDIRTPLNAIFGFTALAKNHLNDPDSDKVSYYLDKISSSSEQLLDLIDKVLELAWSDTDNIGIMETECSLTQIITNVKNFLASQASEKNITISLDFTGLTRCNIYSDPDSLEKLLMHLAHNAVKYTPDGGLVSISAAQLQTLPNDYAIYQMIVEDNGIGISSDFMKSIYKPFEREKNTTFSGVLGTGLGLTITKNIVEAMGGTIEAQSTLGSGSKFTVTLRFRTQTNPVEPSMSTEDTITYLTSQKILLVEDNEINLEIETALLEGLGFHIDTAMDGKTAVEIMEKASPGDYALILMDIQMPVMNGHQAARAIRKLQNEELSRIPIIALSADAFESDRRKSIESGMDAHLPKPIDVPVLLDTIAKTLQAHKHLYGT